MKGVRDRLWRTGLLAEILASRRHDVLWWTSTVDHFRKRYVVDSDARVVGTNDIQIQFLHGRLYRRNVSFARLSNHAEVGRRFGELGRAEAKPDVILCSFPTIELSKEAVALGLRLNVPVILDVRDLWPDIFMNVLPRWLRPAAKLVLRRSFRETAWAFENCTAVIGVSDKYVDWGLAKGRRGKTARDVVFPLGYRLSDSSPSDAKSLESRFTQSGIIGSSPIVSFAGTFGRTYDLDTVIAAANLVNTRNSTTIQFVICGAGEREQEWKKASAGVPGIAFIGWLPGGELSCLLRRSAVGLAAYADVAPQGIPNKVIEYLAAGLPITCSLPGESRELLTAEGCGEYYAAGNAQQLAASLARILTDPRRHATMAAASQRIFNERYSAAAVYGGLSDYLEARAAEGTFERKVS
jgi:glycosyltransferase involved in cell wall biosynthesis